MVTGARGPAGASVARQLVERGHDVLGVDMDPAGDGPFQVLRVPPSLDPTYPDALFAAAHCWSADLIIPTVSEELTLPALQETSREWSVVIGPRSAVSIASDKWSTYRVLLEAGVPVPASTLGSSGWPAAAGALAGYDGPLVSKPRHGRGGRGVVVHPHPEPLGLTSDSIVQEFAPGTEYAVDLLVSSRWGTVDVVAVLEKTALAQGDVGNGTSVRRLAPGQPADVVAAASDAVLAIGLTGPADVDVRRRHDGSVVVLEINARLGAHSAHVPEICTGILDHYRVLATR